MGNVTLKNEMLTVCEAEVETLPPETVRMKHNPKLVVKRTEHESPLVTCRCAFAAMLAVVPPSCLVRFLPKPSKTDAEPAILPSDPFASFSL